MSTQIHFPRRDQDLAVEEEPDVVAEMAASGAPIRLNTIDGEVVYVNWSNVLYIEASPLVVPAAGEPENS